MKGKWKAMTALALACVLVAAATGPSGFARAAELDAKCSLTVNAGGSLLAEEMEAAGVVLDLYKVASAVPAGDSGAYDYTLAEPYAQLVIPTAGTQEDWTKLEQQAAALALVGVKPDVQAAEPGRAIGELDAGIYLVIARGGNIENYVTRFTAEDGTERIATVAQSEKNRYTFLPELVNLPSKPVDENGDFDMSYPGWVYDVVVTLKPEQTPRLNGIEIVKTLTGFNGSTPATFVFSIDATLDGQHVYSDVVSIVFSEAGTKRLVVEGIPVGAEVTVTEVYSGASYTLVTPATQKAVFSADEIVSVSFTNEPTSELRTGGSITNRFSYDEEGGWTWTPVPDIP